MKFFGSKTSDKEVKRADKKVPVEMKHEIDMPQLEHRYSERSEYMPNMERSDTWEGHISLDSKKQRVLSVNSADTLFSQNDHQIEPRRDSLKNLKPSPRRNSYGKMHTGPLVEKSSLDKSLIKIEGLLGVGMSSTNIGDCFRAVLCGDQLLMYHSETDMQVANIKISNTTHVTPSTDGKQFALHVDGMRPLYLEAPTVLLNLKWVAKLAAGSLQ